MQADGIEANTYTIFQYSVQARLSARTDWISCMYLPQFHRLPFCIPINWAPPPPFKYFLKGCQKHVIRPH